LTVSSFGGSGIICTTCLLNNTSCQTVLCRSSGIIFTNNLINVACGCTIRSPKVVSAE